MHGMTEAGPAGPRRGALVTALLRLREAGQAQREATVLREQLLGGDTASVPAPRPAPDAPGPPADIDLRHSLASRTTTPRERQVFAHLLRGFTNRQIARSLGISEQTVKNHLRSVFAKLGVADRLQAVLA